RLDLQRNDPATRLQAAFARLGILPPPAARARICARLHCPGARRAADAGIAFVVQGVLRKVTSLDIRPHVGFGPFQHGADLPQPVTLVPSHRLAERAFRRLFATHARHPGFVARYGALEGLDLADAAAGLAFIGAEVETVDAI